MMMLVDIAAGLVIGVRRRRRSGSGLVRVLRSWVGSRRIEREVARCMLRIQGGRRMLAVRPVSWRLRGAIRSLGGP